MLRRAITGPPYFPLSHCQCLSTLRPSPYLQSPTSWRSFSTSLAPLFEEDSESPRSGNSQNHPSPTGASSSAPEAVDGSSAAAAARPAEAEAEKNAFGAARAPADNATKSAHETGSPPPTRPRTRPRTLRPLIAPALFPPSLHPITPIRDPPSSSSSSSHEQVATTETDSPTTTTTSVTLTSLPPNTLRADVRLVMQRFGEVIHVLVSPGGRRADVVFADAHGVRRTLHAYAERPLRVRGKEVIVFRKRADVEGGVEEESAPAAAVDAAWRDSSHRTFASSSARVHEDGAIFVAGFPAGTTQEALAQALAQFGQYERISMRPDSKYAFIMYSDEDRVQEILRVHEKVPITLRGRTLRIEYTDNRPFSLSPGNLGHALELGKPLDPATSGAIVEELEWTVPRWRGSCEPSRVIWLGCLPMHISREALANFWSRLGCVVEVRTSLYGFAHIEFASTEEAVRAVRQGAPHGFRYEQHLLDIDFAPWEFHIGPAYRVVYISGWLASNGWRALSQWAYDIPNVVASRILPPFRGEERSAPRGAFLQLGTIQDAREALRMLDGRAGPNGEKLQVGLTRLPAVHTNRLWRWAYEVQDREKRGVGEKEGEAYFEDEWEGLGFGTGKEDLDVDPVPTRSSRNGGGERRTDLDDLRYLYTKSFADATR